jgi:hypothetical protein
MLSSPIGICQSTHCPDELIITDSSNHKLRLLKLNPDASMGDDPICFYFTSCGGSD